jgi:hypothetical protein
VQIYPFLAFLKLSRIKFCVLAFNIELFIISHIFPRIFFYSFYLLKSFVEGSFGSLIFLIYFCFARKLFTMEILWENVGEYFLVLHSNSREKGT